MLPDARSMKFGDGRGGQGGVRPLVSTAIRRYPDCTNAARAPESAAFRPTGKFVNNHMQDGSG